ncbi:hypothetical protein QBC41DRAFT_382993 [Cercophora samala]|uniref:Uncharacterized protein n=1 Tax=Cercophora samala TaxID=330535 RepID=A0AA39YZ61_9PEZI|nr:hypothetical protein QBC41DRAFT_382993 [Cercophora samala]
MSFSRAIPTERDILLYAEHQKTLFHLLADSIGELATQVGEQTAQQNISILRYGKETPCKLNAFPRNTEYQMLNRIVRDISDSLTCKQILADCERNRDDSKIADLEEEVAWLKRELKKKETKVKGKARQPKRGALAPAAPIISRDYSIRKPAASGPGFTEDSPFGLHPYKGAQPLGPSLANSQSDSVLIKKEMSEQDSKKGGIGAGPATPLAPMWPSPTIPPAVNANGIHFQPQVPSTQFGPMTQTYIPRRDPPAFGFLAGPVGGYPQVTGQVYPSYQIAGHAVQGGYMMGPQGPMVPSPAGVSMPGPQGGPIPPSAPGAGMAYPPMQPGMHPLMHMPNGHGQNASPGSPIAGAQPRVHFEPALGIGLTQSERLAADIERAKMEGCFEPHEFMPTNRDPFKEWWVEEVDGHWGLYQRRQIDQFKHKWCVRDGWFYAKRLEGPPDV